MLAKPPPQLSTMSNVDGIGSGCGMVWAFLMGSAGAVEWMR